MSEGIDRTRNARGIRRAAKAVLWFSGLYLVIFCALWGGRMLLSIMATDPRSGWDADTCYRLLAWANIVDLILSFSPVILAPLLAWWLFSRSR